MVPVLLHHHPAESILYIEEIISYSCHAHWKFPYSKSTIHNLAISEALISLIKLPLPLLLQRQSVD